jgi:CheY-like chemotaxis protein
MKYPIRILVVEDTEQWRRAVKGYLRKQFESFPHYQAPTVHMAEDGYEAMKMIEQEVRGGHPYDFVSLDINLGGNANGAPPPNGLDVLERIHEFDGAFFTTILTGAATDTTLERQYGAEAAAVMQVGLQCEAARYFPPERIRVVNKPARGTFVKRWDSVAGALAGVIRSFEYAAAWRYVFRPMAADRKFWEMRWNGGHFVRVGDKAGLPELHYILQSIGREDEELAVSEMMARVHAVLTHRRGGGGKRRETKVQTEDNGGGARETLVFEDLVRMLANAWQSGEVNEAGVYEFYDLLGTSQFEALYNTISRRSKEDPVLGPLAEMMDGILTEAKSKGEPSRGRVRLVPRTQGAAAGVRRDRDAADANHHRMLVTFRQQWRRIMAHLNDLGLQGMAAHLEEAVDRGQRNPGRCTYNSNRAVRWVLQ